MARVKKKDHENLTATNIQKVIDLLDADKPITKKEACEILNISYNTTRLSKIIEGHHERVAYTKKRKAQNRGKAASDFEIQTAVTEYLQGHNVSTISKGMYRSAGFVKALLERIGVPTKPSSAEEKAQVGYLPDSCVAEEFSHGELAWSARYHAIVEIRDEISPEYSAKHKGVGSTNYLEKYGSRCYSVYVREANENDFNIAGGYSGYSLAYDLGKLTHLKKYGVKLEAI